MDSRIALLCGLIVVGGSCVATPQRRQANACAKALPLHAEESVPGYVTSRAIVASSKEALALEACRQDAAAIVQLRGEKARSASGLTKTVYTGLVAFRENSAEARAAGLGATAAGRAAKREDRQSFTSSVGETIDVTPVVVGDLRAAGIRRVAITTVKLEAEEGLAGSLTELTVTQASQVPGLAVVTASDVAAILGYEQQRDLLGCENASCVAEIAGALGVDGLLVSTVGRLGSTYLVTFKLIDVHRARVLARLTVKARGESDVLIEVFERGVGALLEPFASQPTG